MADDQAQRLRAALERLYTAVRSLGKCENGITLFEAKPTESDAALAAWWELNNAQKEAADALTQAHSNDPVICPECRGERRIKGSLCPRCSGCAQIKSSELRADETAPFKAHAPAGEAGTADPEGLANTNGIGDP